MTYRNLLQITVTTCVWPKNIRFKGHIVAFSQRGGGLLQHIKTPKMSAFMQPSPLMG